MCADVCAEIGRTVWEVCPRKRRIETLEVVLLFLSGVLFTCEMWVPLGGKMTTFLYDSHTVWPLSKPSDDALPNGFAFGYLYYCSVLLRVTFI